ncbi:hypothetical protein [Alicyclobacillus vulcanalis]|uniref:Uncharacterized protein n=1 Tax=Alicyclobacillus vulcanalis TaxID=252246 RepID=A0A1N7LX56_9BACL|nr:hypothetical protein [Alicyclobacillus vulcanalis]SIS78291.1 hypothetical protein SAMN05421799_10440 [Alicyclobacillus vulcanalis]
MNRYPSKRSVMLASLLATAIAMAIPTDPPFFAAKHAHARALHGAVAAMAPVEIEPMEERAGTGSGTKPQAPPPNGGPARQKSGAGANPGQPAGERKPAKPPSAGHSGAAKPKAATEPKPADPKPADPKPAAPKSGATAPAPNNNQPAGPESWGYTRKTAKLRIRVIDGRTKQPLQNAEVVLIETEQRFKTDAQGYTPWFDAPVLRNPRYRPMVAELHGQLGAIAYKDGYRDSIHLGIRVHEGIRQQTTIWMYKLGPADRRIEPVLYQEPYHHLWLIQLADKFRSHSQPGEGPERP